MALWAPFTTPAYVIALKLLQDSRRRRKGSLQKILCLLQARQVLLLQVCFLTTLLFSSENSIALRSCYNYHDTITDGLNIYRIGTVMPGSGRHFLCPARQPSGLFFAAFNAICLDTLLLLISLLVAFYAHTPLKENSSRDLLVTPRAKAIPPKYIEDIT